jgi:hypothetical protein
MPSRSAITWGIAVGEVAHELACSGIGEPVDEVVHELPHPGSQLVDRHRGERLADQTADTPVGFAFDVEDHVGPQLGHWAVGDSLAGQVVGAGLTEAAVAEDGGAVGITLVRSPLR